MLRVEGRREKSAAFTFVLINFRFNFLFKFVWAEKREKKLLQNVYFFPNNELIKIVVFETEDIDDC